MELRDALRSTGSIRSFQDRPVSDELLFEILDDARFGPSGGNRQAWHVTVLKDPTLRARVGELYLDAWHDYVGHVLSGLTPFSPTLSPTERDLAASKRPDAIAISKPDGFAETIARAPILLAVSVELGSLAATDRDLNRYQIVGGASVYPFVWNILLAAHERGLGGVMTTVATRKEPEIATLLHLPDQSALASIVALGYPTTRPTKLKRRAVGEFTSIDYADGATFQP